MEREKLTEVGYGSSETQSKHRVKESKKVQIKESNKGKEMKKQGLR